MRNAKKLKETKISINEDLTKVNQSVLASVRVHGKSDIVKSWSLEGKLYAKYKNDVVKKIEYADYAHWLSQWPEKGETSSTNL